MKVLFIISVLIFEILTISSCVNFKNNSMDNNMKIISDPNSSQYLLLKSVSNLKSIKEKPVFWTSIANSEKYRAEHRRVAVFMLFKRHIKSKISLMKLGEILDNPTWLKYENINTINTIIGEMPIKFNLNDNLISIYVFPELPKDSYNHWAIYLRVEGKMKPEDFYEIIKNGGINGNTELKERKLLEFGLSPDSPEEDH